MNRRTILPYLLLTLFGSACSPLIVADSIGHLSRPEISTAMPSSATNSSRGREYYTTGIDSNETGLQAVINGAASLTYHQWLVIELGTNNIDDGAPLTTWFFTQAMANVPDTVCVAVVTPWASHDQAGAAVVEAAAKAAVTQWQPCRAFVEWDDAVRANPALVYDGVHPTHDGAVVLANLIAAATS